MGRRLAQNGIENLIIKYRNGCPKRRSIRSNEHRHNMPVLTLFMEVFEVKRIIDNLFFVSGQVFGVVDLEF